MIDDNGGPRPHRGAICLRAIRSDDVADCISLLAQLGYPMTVDEMARRLAEVLSVAEHAVLIAETAGRVAGLMHVFVRPAIENPREAVVQAIVVDEAHRRAGIGECLMAAAERWGREHGCRSVVLSSNAARAPAHAFYQALGYGVSATSYVFRKPL
jgi:GNAT superfamily N-acetyltransferase